MLHLYDLPAVGVTTAAAKGEICRFICPPVAPQVNDNCVVVSPTPDDLATVKHDGEVDGLEHKYA